MKERRHAKILKIIEDQTVETQEDLTGLLSDEGFDVTQATVSRDIRDLKLVKTEDESGVLRYAALADRDDSNYYRIIKVFSQAFLSADHANNIVVIKTLSGMANAVAAAVDASRFSNILGTIAGDDTVMIVCRTNEHAAGMAESFNSQGVT